MKSETYICDIKGCNNNAEHKGINIQVIFTTEQTEGRPIVPYLCGEKVDICQNCLDKVLKGNYIFATGAMGNNEYKLKTNRK